MKRSRLKRNPKAIAEFVARGRASDTLSRKAGLGRGKGPVRGRGREKTPDAWKEGVPAGHHRHHVVYRQHVRVAGGDQWDLANSMILSETVHYRHHSRVDVVPLGDLPASAIAFAVDLFGQDGAYSYLRRQYACHDPDCYSRFMALLTNPPE